MPVNMSRIQAIESSGNPRAYNKKSGARGLYQITPIVVKEWNNFNPNNQYTVDDMYDPAVNTQIANWYMNQRIPQMLEASGLPVTPGNMLWAYNAGVGRVKQGVMPSETKEYIKRYNALQE